MTGSLDGLPSVDLGIAGQTRHLRYQPLGLRSSKSWRRRPWRLSALGSVADEAMVAPAPVNGSTTSEAVSGGIDHYELGFGDLPAWQTTEVAWSAARDKVREDLLEAGIGAQSSCSLPFINVRRAR